MAEKDPREQPQTSLTGKSAEGPGFSDGGKTIKQGDAPAKESKSAVKSSAMTAEAYDTIKSGRLNEKNGNREGGLLDPEHNTAQDWHKMAGLMLAHVGKDVPEDRKARVDEIKQMLKGATSRRDPVPHGYGPWFLALVDLFEIADVPEGATAPTEEEILNAREPGDIRAELAARYDQRKIGGGGTKDKPDSMGAAERSEVI